MRKPPRQAVVVVEIALHQPPRGGSGIAGLECVGDAAVAKVLHADPFLERALIDACLQQPIKKKVSFPLRTDPVSPFPLPRAQRTGKMEARNREGDGTAMPSRQENKQHMEQRLYDAAIDLFCELGYKKTTLTDIASEAGVSTRTLYKYFPTKESILRKFSRENILSLKAFAGELPADMPLKEQVVETMVHDFNLMFGLFDVSYILHSARDESGMFARFELENILASESIYCNLFKQEQLRRGIEPNEAVALCASIVMGLYRHCNDLYRFRKKGTFDEKDLRAFYATHINAVWESLHRTLLAEPAKNAPLGSIDRHLFGSMDA